MAKFANEKWSEFIAKTAPQWAAIGADLEKSWGSLRRIFQDMKPVIDVAAQIMERMANFSFGGLITSVGALKVAFDAVANVVSGVEHTLDMISGHPMNSDVQGIIKDQQERAKRGGHVGDNPGTTPDGKPTSSTSNGNRNIAFHNTFNVNGKTSNDLAKQIAEVLQDQMRRSYA